MKNRGYHIRFDAALLELSLHLAVPRAGLHDNFRDYLQAEHTAEARQAVIYIGLYEQAISFVKDPLVISCCPVERNAGPALVFLGYAGAPILKTVTKRDGQLFGFPPTATFQIPGRGRIEPLSYPSTARFGDEIAVSNCD